MQEKFSLNQVAKLRSELLQSGMDCFYVAEAITLFLAEHGYGISQQDARDLALHIEGINGSGEGFRRRLESSALMM